METDTCRTCGEVKPLDMFMKDRSRPTGRRHKCKACAAKYYRSWQNQNPERAAQLRREAVRRYSQRVGWRKRRYGLNDEDFEAHLMAQGDACAICQRPFKQICTDHIKGTKFVRGLLCHDCNRAIGLLRDDSEVIERAAAYVRERVPGWQLPEVGSGGGI
ncbi:endonuclease domain-containing protein [Verrucosispora sp. WMMC514]|uniref:endonuclease domain-containing protein n=1 Tax=Verrucosispora sp. WMMC514 TaxID=3015156 RepID=UPI00248D1D44|nr:endonuclease domain-containing protein [Verrucosispora sp. WMMC514]WBB94107.1 endonuclease domain-containing protein [Verrucosispora sp. WMMC514]